MGCTEMQGECVRICDEVLGWNAQPEDSGSMAVAGGLAAIPGIYFSVVGRKVSGRVGGMNGKA